MVLNKELLTALNKKAQQYWWATSQWYKDYVNSALGEWWYDKFNTAIVEDLKTQTTTPLQPVNNTPVSWIPTNNLNTPIQTNIGAFGDNKWLVTTPNIDVKPIEPVKVETPVTPTVTGTTWKYDTWSTILDTTLTDISKNKDTVREQTIKWFTLWKADFDKNKSYYSNYDQVNNLFTGVIKDVTDIYNKWWTPTDTDYQNIATKYNLTLDEVKNPASISNRWTLTAEWADKFGKTKAEATIAQSQTDYDRYKADMQTKIEQTQQNYNWQIEDVAKQVARNAGWTEAQGAWSWALRGSWYLQGIENIRKDWENTINRLKTLAQQASTASEEDLARTKEDFDKWLAQSKKDMDTQLSDLKQNSILALSEAQATYWLWSDKLTKALEQINNEYWIKSNEAVSSYLWNIKSMNDIANQNITLVEQVNKQNEAKANLRYNEYLANNGAILWQTSLTKLADDVTSGKISIQKVNDLKQIMLSSIQSTLWKIAPITTQELKTVETLLSQGYTPAQIVAEMQTLDKFKPKKQVDKTLDLWDTTRIYYNDWSSEDVKTQTTKPTERYELKEVWGKTYKFNQVTWDYQEVWATWIGWTTWSWYDFIKKQEWFRDKAYWDVNWWAVWYWQHSINGVPVKEWDTIDKTTADSDFQNRVNNAKFQWLVKTNLTENQEAALYDLEHNVWSWVWNFPNGKAIIESVNNNDFEKASNIMATSWIWTTNASTKEVMPWLVKRRKEASKLLLDTWTVWTWKSLDNFTDEVKNWWENIVNWVWWAKITSIKDNDLRNEVSSYIAEKTKTQPNQNVNVLKQNLSLLEELESHPWLKGSIWIWTKWFFPWTQSAWFMARLKQLEAKQFMEWIQQMKWMWSLSDAEWKKVSASISSLNDTRQSENDWKSELQKVKSILQEKINWIEETTWLKFDNLWKPIIPVDTTWMSTAIPSLSQWRWQSWTSQWRWQWVQSNNP